MKSIRCWRDLEDYGIRLLTGEACRVGMRYLCDLTPKGKLIVEDLLGLPINTVMAQSWNRSGAVASVMLPYDMLTDLAAWALLSHGHRKVAVLKGGVVGTEDEDTDEDWNKLLDFHRHTDSLVRTYHISTSLPGRGTRCEQTMSGRVE